MLEELHTLDDKTLLAEANFHISLSATLLNGLSNYVGENTLEVLKNTILFSEELSRRYAESVDFFAENILGNIETDIALKPSATIHNFAEYKARKENNLDIS